MADKVNSYSYANQVRDVNEVFQTVVRNRPVLSTLLRVSDRNATSTKYEWLEDVVTPKSWVLDANYVAADGEITVTSATGLVAGMIFVLEQATGASTKVY